MLSNKDFTTFSLEYLVKVYKDYKLNAKQVPLDLEEFFIENASEFDSYLVSYNVEDETQESETVESGELLKQQTNVYKILAQNIIKNYIKNAPLSFSSSLVFNDSKKPAELNLNFYNLSQAELTKNINLNGEFGFFNTSVQDIFEKLESLLKNDTAYHISHLPTNEQEWFLQEIANTSLVNEERQEIFENLAKSEVFESFLAKKFPGVKRFGADGLESFMVFLLSLTKFAKQQNVTDILSGMAHRGRLNSLVNFTNKPLSVLLAEFLGNYKVSEESGLSYDVKYHMGYKGLSNGVNVEILPNPSHLEVVNPVVLGKVKALQDERKEHKSSLPLLIHGDSAYLTLGVNQETFTLKELNGYCTKGTVHVVLNNGLGFTAQAGVDYLSNHNAWGDFLNCPVLHIYANEVEALYKAGKLAINYRQKFNKDIFINIIGHRKFGHNEGDEPKFTNPLYYKNSTNIASYTKTYQEKLVSLGFNKEELNNFVLKQNSHMEQELKDAKSLKVGELVLNNNWGDFNLNSHNKLQEGNTAIKSKELLELCNVICKEPESFALNSKIKRQIQNRKELIESNKIDWAGAELLAYASLLKQGFNVRLSGEDSKRGTFSHRHACYVDQENGSSYNVLSGLESENARFNIYNSTISEFGVLGFDYGYSLYNPNTLTIWEAQFGDFANGGQVIIDQFIASAESKWLMLSNLVMLLPHGLEGQGPEHSSARLERFLQLCANNNITVAYPTTSANMFHLLRRQVVSGFKKPLVVMSPKSLLRHSGVLSSLSDLSEGGFNKVIVEKENKKDFKGVIVCTGKVYYDLLEHKQQNNIEDFAIIRLEQLYPFPTVELQNVLKDLNFTNLIWAQEEHENSGAYTYVKDKLATVLKELGKNTKVYYAGRKESAAPACGYSLMHNAEKQEVLQKAFNL